MDCGYCRQLHSEIAQYNKLGIRVRYAAFPRTGPGSPSWKKAEAVWCSKDRKDALTRAKLGQNVSAAQCATPVAAEYELGNQIGVNGTPSIFTEKGEMVGGYVPAAQLAQYLDGGAPAIAGAASKSSN
jgi:thiol:disulfide interchange protein DsbC